MEDNRFHSEIEEARNFLVVKDYDSAATVLLETFVNNPPLPIKPGSGLSFINQIIPSLLLEAQYHYVARLLWPESLFDLRPKSVQAIWAALPNESELIVQGAGSMSKSYTMAAWLLLDWLCDPEYTCVNIVSITAEHARRNVFAHIKNLHAKSLVPLPGHVKDRSITVGNDPQQGIHLVAVPQGDDGAGRLQGLHVVPRKSPHHYFGSVSRIRAILDEAEEIPSGIWLDVDNFLIGKSSSEHIKVFCAANPRDRSSLFGQRCEPKDGWTSISIDTSYEWQSKLGWKILRLDGATCENVVERKQLFPGFITYEGFQRYVALGIDHPEYYTMGRGWFPEANPALAIISPSMVDRNIGDCRFISSVVYCAAVDLAFEGGDRAVMSIGRYGLADGWQPYNQSFQLFDRPRNVLQLETQFELAKAETDAMTTDIITKCKAMSIKPQWLIVDRTGNGTGVHDMLKVRFGHEVLGLNFGDGSSHTKILEEDTEFADELYHGVWTELWFATRKFLEFGYLKLTRHTNFNELIGQYTSRRYKQSTQGRVIAESKREYKKRGFRSPDHGDSANLLVHLVRQRTDFVASMGYVSERSTFDRGENAQNQVDKLDFISFQ